MQAKGEGIACQLTQPADEVDRLCAEHYNATVTAIIPVQPDLRIVRVVPDGGVPRFEAGQYFTLGLGNWEPRVAGVDEEHLNPAQQERVCQRAYSASCSILDASGQLRRPHEFDYLEFYVTLVRHADRHPPGLTPRLFALTEGARLFVSANATGHYTLREVGPQNDIFFFATGTGEAAHNAMTAELLACGHRGQIVSAVSVRFLQDAAYRRCHRELTRRFPNYRYFLSVTRGTHEDTTSETDSSQHLQQVVASGALERHTGVSLDPAKAHVFLCGNPTMIGLTPHSGADHCSFAAGSMLDLLLRRGFRPDQHGESGNVHFERYW